MKIPSLFGRTPNYQRFKYTPRYYDPKQEEKLEREERLRKELEMEMAAKGERVPVADTDSVHMGYRDRMRGSFQAARKRSKMDGNVVLIRLASLLFVSLLLFGFLQWGKVVFYSLFLVFPIWIWLRFFRRN